MKTYWVRICCELEQEISFVDNWTTGYLDKEGWGTRCFCVRANSEDEIYDLLIETLYGGTYEVDFIEEKGWKVYGDFCAVKGRFRMAKKYLDDPIDDIKTVRIRAGLEYR